MLKSHSSSDNGDFNFTFEGLKSFSSDDIMERQITLIGYPATIDLKNGDRMPADN